LIKTQSESGKQHCKLPSNKQINKSTFTKNYAFWLQIIEKISKFFFYGNNIANCLQTYKQIGSQGRAIIQAVSRWLSSAAARVRARVWSSGICGGQFGEGAGFLRLLGFPLSIFIPPNSNPHNHPGRVQ
jgi:hypothetical protein